MNKLGGVVGVVGLAGLAGVAAVAWALLGCSKSSNAVTCGETVASYCGTHTCATHVDPNDVVASFCQAQMAINDFGSVTCPDGGGAFDIETQTSTAQGIVFEYDSTGQLVAVLQSDVDAGLGCAAGPSSYELPGSCKSNLVGYSCARDGGAD